MNTQNCSLAAGFFLTGCLRTPLLSNITIPVLIIVAFSFLVPEEKYITAKAFYLFLQLKSYSGYRGIP
jgi:hypothetical protein